MTDERIDIEVSDKISPVPAKKLREIAASALEADTAIDRVKASLASIDASALTRLATASSRLTNATAKETSATARLITARAKVNTETARAAVTAQKLATEQQRTQAATERAEAASTRARIALVQEEAASIRLTAAKHREAAAQDEATSAAHRASTAATTLGAQIDAAFSTGAVRRAAADIQAYGTELDRLRAKHNPVFAVIQRYKSTLAELRQAHKVGAISSNELANAISRERKESLASISALKGRTGALQASTRASVGAARGSRLAAHQTQNLIYQVNDVVVSLASGQKPMTVLLQQGSQIATVFGPGTGVLRIFRGLVGAVASIVRQFFPLIAVVGGVFAGLKSLQKSIIGTTDVAVTAGDTMRASFQLVSESIYSQIKPAVDFLAPYFSKAYNLVAGYTRQFANLTVGLIVGTVRAISIVWNKIPQLFSDAMVLTWNFILDITNFGVSGVLRVFSGFINTVVGLFVGSYKSVVGVWGLLPDAFRDLAAASINGMLFIVESGVEGVLGAITELLEFIGSAAELVGQNNPFADLLDPTEILNLEPYKIALKGTGREISDIISTEFRDAFSRDYAGGLADALDVSSYKQQTLGAIGDTAKLINDGYRDAFATDFVGSAFAAIRARAIEIATKRIALEKSAAASAASATKELTRKEQILADIQKPLAAYLEDTSALKELLDEGAISLGQYNEALSSLSIVESLRNVDKALKGTTFAAQAAIDEIRKAEQERLNVVRYALSARVISEQDAASRISAINGQALQDIAKLNEEVVKGASTTKKEVVQLSRKQEILKGINAPLAAYATDITALNELLAEGAITTGRYNAALSKLSAVSGLQQVDKALKGTQFAQEAQVSAIRNLEQERLNAVQTALDARIISEASAAARIVAINAQTTQELAALNKTVAAAEEKTVVQLSRKEELIKSIREPITTYKNDVAALNDLFKDGAISAIELSQAIAGVGLVVGLRQVDQALKGTNFAKQAQIDEIRAVEEQRLNIVQQALKARIISETEAANRVVAIGEQAAQELALIGAEVATAEKEAIVQLSRKEKLLKSIREPITSYRTDMAALNALLKDGAISAQEFTNAVAGLSISQNLQQLDSGLTGTTFADEAKLEEIRAAEQERLLIVQQALEARVISEQQAAERIVSINRQSAGQIQAIESARQSAILQGAQDTFKGLASAARDFAGEQSAAYKVLFAVSKAFAIADSIIKIQQGVASALALPFPTNIGAIASVAAAGANIISSIQSVAANGFMDGGYTGNGAINGVAGVVHGQEYVFDAKATRQIGVPTLDALRRGTSAPINDNRAYREQSGTTNVSVRIENYGTDKQFEVKQLTKNDVVVIAKDVASKTVRDEAPNVVASDIFNPNGRVSKSLSDNTNVTRKR